jgi:hypothetical protein
MRRPGSDRRRRSPDAWASDHERAQFRAAQRLDGPLGARESMWLDDHLAHCAECNDVARAYQDDRRALRSLPAPEPPRDLWAHTAAALDREAERPARRGGFRIGWSAPLGALAGVLVVAVVVGASLVSQRNRIVPVQNLPEQSATTASASSAPESTPLTVTAEDVGFVHRGADNTIQIFNIPVTKVCSADAAPDCPPATDVAKAVIKLPRKPGNIIGSPNQTQIVVVDDTAATSGGTVSVVPVTSTDSASPSPSAVLPSTSPSVGPSASERLEATEPDAECRAPAVAFAVRLALTAGIDRAVGVACRRVIHRHRLERDRRRSIGCVFTGRAVVRVLGPPGRQQPGPRHLCLDRGRCNRASRHERPPLHLLRLDRQ